MRTTFAKRMEFVKASEVRELLKVTENKEIISFAGGMPAPELFPIETIITASEAVLRKYGSKAMQYGTTDGIKELRCKIAERYSKYAYKKSKAENIIITSGSQQGLDFTGKIFLDNDDLVLCESPTYLAAISAFKVYGAKFLQVATDNEGMLPDDLEEKIKNPRVKLIYVIPDFQNPTGRVWSLERREKLLKLAAEYGVYVIEDTPYSELRFEGERVQSLKDLDTENIVIQLGTFSKILCPGYRVGWVNADTGIIEKYNLVKQSADLHTSTVSQLEINELLEIFDVDSHIENLRALYKRRRDLAVTYLHKHFSSEATFSTPTGGLFLWLKLTHINARTLLKHAIDEGVVFTPGGAFYPDSPDENCLRFNYSFTEDHKFEEGIRRMKNALQKIDN